MRRIGLLLLMLSLLGCNSGPSEEDIRQEALRQQAEARGNSPGAPESPPSPDGAAMDDVHAKTTQDICAGDPVPNGWIKVNDHWDPTSCGDPVHITYNVWTIERYSDKPIGARMRVCASAPTPAGWTRIATHWMPTGCGHPRHITQNVKTIRRDS